MREERVLAEAARWRARLEAADCSAEDRHAYERWCAADPLHAQASATAERITRGVDRLAADPRLQALAQRALESGSEHRALPQRRRWFVPAAVAASAILAVIGVQMAPEWLGGSVATHAYSTAELRRAVTLEDGSVVHLDVGTRVRVRLSESVREIELMAGRALFQVAHDAQRPFTVKAASSLTTALGTVFQVEHDGDEVIVTLSEGSVMVANERPTTSWREQLAPGEQLTVDSVSARPRKQQIDPQIATSWIRGRHLFRGTPLSEALGEVNRYTTKKVRLGDPGLADLPVAGSFVAGDSELIVEALAAVLPLRVVEGSGGELILFGRFESHDE